MNNREYTKPLKSYSMVLTVKEAAEILRVSTKLIYKMIHEGSLPAIKIGRENRISKTAIVEYMKGVKPKLEPKICCR